MFAKKVSSLIKGGAVILSNFSSFLGSNLREGEEVRVIDCILGLRIKGQYHHSTLI